MIESRASILEKLEAALSDDPHWSGVVASVDALVQIHLAVFVEPYLTLIAKGKKTIETRFSKNRIAPFQTVEVGDIILLKRAGGAIAGICAVEKVWFYNLLPGALEEIRDKFSPGICPRGSDFWSNRSEASYCSLIWVRDFKCLNDIPFKKADRRGWVILK